MARGRFITLEGGDGAGKSTQTKRLVAWLRQKGIEAVATREIGGAPGAEEIRTLWLDKGEGYWDPLTELMLIMAARREHLAKTVWPALERGAWVVSDRFVDSARAYQGLGQGLGLEQVDRLYAIIAPDFWPDVTLLLDLPVEKGLARTGRGDRFERMDNAFHEKLRSAYLELAQKEPARFSVIDARAGAGGVAASIRATLAARFGLKDDA